MDGLFYILCSKIELKEVNAAMLDMHALVDRI
jgi:hypothetical protein